MDIMDIEKATNYVERQIKWQVRKKTCDKDFYYIQSNPFVCIHNIYTCSKLAGIQPEYAMLHELVHALLAETVHIFLSSIIYTSDEINFFSKYEFVFQIASDWFVENYCIRLIGITNYINNYNIIQTFKTHYQYLNSAILDDDSKCFTFGLLEAILAKNDIEDISIHLKTINKVKKILLRTSTEPSKSNFLELSNNLLKIITDYQVVPRNINNVETLVIDYP